MPANCTLLQGDSRHLPLLDRSVHCVVTSPPYWGLRDYGTGSWHGGDLSCVHTLGREGAVRNRVRCVRCGAVRVDQQTGLEQLPDCLAWARHEPPCGACYVCVVRAVFQELGRVLRNDGTVWLNLGDSYAQAGGSNSAPPKPGPAASRRPLPIEARTLRRSRALPGLKKKDLIGIPWRVALALQADGWYLRTDIIWTKGSVMPESVTDRPTRAHEYIFLLTKSKRYYYDQTAIAEPVAADSQSRYHQATLNTQRGGFKQEQYAAGLPGQKARNRRPAEILKGLAQKSLDMKGTPTRNARSVWRINTQPTKLAHFATFPQELPRRCILAGTSARGCCPACGAPWQRMVEKSHADHTGTTASLYPAGSNGQRISLLRQTARAGGTEYVPHTVTLRWVPGCACPPHEPVPCTVLDPFMGAGTTGLVAQRLGRSFVGVDLNGEYVEMARQRMLEALV